MQIRWRRVQEAHTSGRHPARPRCSPAHRLADFTKDDVYIGPLPRNCGHAHARLIGQDEAGFKTRGAAAHPPG
eukprot:13888589-Alexandrium_andersonii.AAC.1